MVAFRFFIICFSLFFFSTSLMALTKEFSFETGSQAWVGDFVDYPEKQEKFYELAWGWESLPIDNNSPFEKGIYLAGNNHSDDLFMYIKTPISDLKKNTLYAVTLMVDFASDVPPGTMGAGGAQGESVYIKVGASTQEPAKTLVDGYYQLNVNKGNQKEEGGNAVVVGNLANALVDPNSPKFALLRMDNNIKPLVVKTNAQGQLWVFVGTDSGYEGITKYYIGKIIVNLKEQ